ncbi:MAG: hypothetical protein M3117_00985 [Actinomycetota bacterium]|nr:hypothetical protein [Actinomycetota bacterium]
MFGLALLFFGYVAPGIVILVISAVVALGFIASRTRDPRPSGAGRGSFYGGAAGSAGGYGDGDNGGGGDGGFDGGGGGDGGG